MSQIFTELSGQGRPLVVLHGWGMNQQVWQPIRTALSTRAQVHWIDLPGHGRSYASPMGSLPEVVEQLVDLIPPQAVIMGWSLGGLIAQALARHPHVLASALILVASTPRFVASEDWPHGVDYAVLDGFARNLQKDYAATVKRFFALQFMGVRSDPVAINALRDSIMAWPATTQALMAGLDILASADYRSLLPTCPTLWLLGRLDKLIPVSLATGLAELGQQHIEVMSSAAHVPFVTHPEEFMARIGAFLDEH